MNTTTTTQEQRDMILALLKSDRWQQAEGASRILGFESITEALEHIVKTDGLHDGVILAIATYYDNDLGVSKHIVQARGSEASSKKGVSA